MPGTISTIFDAKCCPPQPDCRFSVMTARAVQFEIGKNIQCHGVRRCCHNKDRAVSVKIHLCRSAQQAAADTSGWPAEQRCAQAVMQGRHDIKHSVLTFHGA